MTMLLVVSKIVLFISTESFEIQFSKLHCCQTSAANELILYILLIDYNTIKIKACEANLKKVFRGR